MNFKEPFFAGGQRTVFCDKAGVYVQSGRCACGGCPIPNEVREATRRVTKARQERAAGIPADWPRDHLGTP